MSDKSGALVRVAAARVVEAVLNGQSLDASLPGNLAPFDARDRALLQEIAYGTVRWWLRITHYIDALAHKPVERPVRALVATGIYQLAWTRIPPHAAVAATVEAVDASGYPRARGLVNALLRNFLRRQSDLELSADQDPVARHAHPRWYIDALGRDWPADAGSILAADNVQAPMTLRVNRRCVTRETYLSKLSETGHAASVVRHATEGIVLESPCPVEDLPGFSDGLVSVQDAASQLAAPLLECGPGMRVLDACAAPGGKACHVLERHDDLSGLVAVDIDGARLDRVRGNLNRLRLQADLTVGDAASPDDWWDGEQFHRILIDAPCTATGVIRRHPDIRLLRREDDLAVLARRQHDLLVALWPLLAPGGRLVYATCAVLRAENEAVISAVLGDLHGARVAGIEADWGRPTPVGRQILPGDDDMDGFHYACLVKPYGPESA